MLDKIVYNCYVTYIWTDQNSNQPQLHICGTLKCENASICKKLAKCEEM